MSGLCVLFLLVLPLTSPPRPGDTLLVLPLLEGLPLRLAGVVLALTITCKAAAVALKQVPEANASYSPEGIAMHHNADIAMAVAIEGGLITPIIRKAETKGLAQIAVEAKDLAERARTR